jgi:type I restriction enzyme R subunit
MLDDAGWKIVDRKDYSPSVSAIAVREGLLKGNKEADYLLFLDGKAIGVLEAKKENTKLSEIVATQAENYTYRLQNWYQYWQKPLPFVYLSNGKELLFRYIRIKTDYTPLQKMHTPQELAKMAGIENEYAGKRLAQMSIRSGYSLGKQLEQRRKMSLNEFKWIYVEGRMMNYELKIEFIWK